jgi:FkbM family methyltransferase
MVPHTTVNDIAFLTPNSQCLWRVQTLLTKEPDTIAWLDTMQPGEVFFDVGANMGQYAMIAAKKGLTVYAFEPEAQNFALLCRNTAFNGFKNLLCWPIAFSNTEKLDFLHVNQLMPGGSCNSFGESVNFKGEKSNFGFAQGSFAITLDDFAGKYASPAHIKIDVDGFEHRVLWGAVETLPTVKSVLVELNSNMPEHVDIIPWMQKQGFRYDEAQMMEARRTEGPFKGIGNVIFHRA